MSIKDMNTSAITSLEEMFGPEGATGLDGVAGENGPKGELGVRGSDDLSRRIKHQADLIKQIEKFPFWDRMFKNAEYVKLKDQIKNHKKHFPEFYL